MRKRLVSKSLNANEQNVNDNDSVTNNDMEKTMSVMGISPNGP